MPKRLVCVEPYKLEWQEYSEKDLGPGQVRVSPEYAAAKHGTEMAFFKGYANPRGRFDADYQLFRNSEGEARPYPFPVGNMIVGTVIERGGQVENVAPGDKVCFSSGFCETAVADADRCFVMPKGMSWKSAVCIDPADFAMAAVRDGHVRVGDAVAVFGLGAIGLMVIQFAQLSGAVSVIGVDPLPNRRDVAEQLGATATLDPFSVDAGLAIKELTGRRGVDVAIEYSGSGQGLQHALRAVAYGGTVVMGAFPPAYGAGLDFGAEAHLNTPRIVFSRACSQPDREHPRWTEKRILEVCWRLLSEGRITGEPIVQPVVGINDLVNEYPKIASDPGHNVKLGLRY